MIELSDIGVEELSIAIIVQAIRDYKELLKCGVNSISEKGKVIDTEELVKFFRGGWCASLMDLTGAHIDPEFIIQSVIKVATTD